MGGHFRLSKKIPSLFAIFEFLLKSLPGVHFNNSGPLENWQKIFLLQLKSVYICWR